MFDYFAGWDPGHVIALVSVMVGGLIAMTAIVSGQWRRVRQAEFEASLKQEMLTRGMSVDVIQRVVRASRRKSDRKC